MVDQQEKIIVFFCLNKHPCKSLMGQLDLVSQSAPFAKETTININLRRSLPRKALNLSTYSIFFVTLLSARKIVVGDKLSKGEN